MTSARRPAVAVSYVVATTAALLSGLCYTQLVVDMPVCGGATFYMANIFGEFASWYAFLPAVHDDRTATTPRDRSHDM